MYSVGECASSGEHLTSCDPDGYCNHCGHQELEAVEAMDTLPPPSDRQLHEHRFTEAMRLGDGDVLWVCFPCGKRKVTQTLWRRIKCWLMKQLRKKSVVVVDVNDTQ